MKSTVFAPRVWGTWPRRRVRLRRLNVTERAFVAWPDLPMLVNFGDGVFRPVGGSR